jgi:hypothetical protein
MTDERDASAHVVGRLRLSIGALAAAMLVTTYVLAGATPSRASTTPPHIMLIVMENQGYAQIIGNSNAPTVNSLANTYASATNWFGLQDSSLADYIALISGTTGTYSAPTLVGELASAKIPWKAYMEDMPSDCYTGKGIGNYSKLHNPFVFFKTIRNTSLCGNVVHYSGSLPLSDLNSTTPPDFVWLTPNECDDMNAKCPTLNDKIKQGDAWLKVVIPAVQSTTWYTQGNGMIVITWDSATTADQSFWHTGSGGHVPTIVVSARTAGLKFSSGGNHYGTLRAIEEAYGVGLLGASVDPANGDLTPAFG